MYPTVHTNVISAPGGLSNLFIFCMDPIFEKYHSNIFEQKYLLEINSFFKEAGYSFNILLLSKLQYVNHWNTLFDQTHLHSFCSNIRMCYLESNPEDLKTWIDIYDNENIIGILPSKYSKYVPSQVTNIIKLRERVFQKVNPQTFFSSLCSIFSKSQIQTFGDFNLLFKDLLTFTDDLA